MSRKKSTSRDAPANGEGGISNAEAARRASVQRIASKKKKKKEKKAAHDKLETAIVVIVFLVFFFGVGYLIISPASPKSEKESRSSRRSKQKEGRSRAEKDNPLEPVMTNETRDPNTPMIIGGYLPDYRSMIALDDSAEYLTDVMLFSLEIKEEGFSVTEDAESTDCCLNDQMFELVKDTEMEVRILAEENDSLRKGNSDLRVFITVGGAGRSSGFSYIAADKYRRYKFVEELKALCIRENVDGVDFDWEQPRSEEEVVNYALLVASAAHAFHASGLLVTLALHPQQPFPGEIFQYLDRIHLMAYDMVAPSPMDKSSFGHHASFKRTIGAVQELLQGGCPASKIVLGIPGYARHHRSPLEVKAYTEIIDEVMKEEEEDGAEPTLARVWNVNSHEGYMFDSPSYVQQKVRYAKEKGLAGVFFWELGQDKRLEGEGGFLLEAAAMAAWGDYDETEENDGGEDGEQAESDKEGEESESDKKGEEPEVVKNEEEKEAPTETEL